ncbi:hypothetical protein LEMLEM_LOCUS664, partial [Lemmus lemmus]
MVLTEAWASFPKYWGLPCPVSLPFLPYSCFSTRNSTKPACFPSHSPLTIAEIYFLLSTNEIVHEIPS